MSNSQILIVDDDSELREAIVDTLMLTGYVCLEASSGEAALDMLSKNRIDMVISDIQMDGMDGHTLLNTIHEKYPQLPVLLMTAYANINGAVRAMRDGAIDYLSKPFAPEVLLNQVSRYVPVSKTVSGEPVFADPSTRSRRIIFCSFTKFFTAIWSTLWRAERKRCRIISARPILTGIPKRCSRRLRLTKRRRRLTGCAKNSTV